MYINWEAVIRDGAEISYNQKKLFFISSGEYECFVVSEDDKENQLFVSFRDAADYLVS